MTTWREADAAKRERLRREQRFYTADKMGPVCADGCGQRVPHALTDIGILAHPSCEPGFAQLVRRKGLTS